MSLDSYGFGLPGDWSVTDQDTALLLADEGIGTCTAKAFQPAAQLAGPRCRGRVRARGTPT